jgi:hypothetical protein
VSVPACSSWRRRALILLFVSFDWAIPLYVLTGFVSARTRGSEAS